MLMEVTIGIALGAPIGVVTAYAIHAILRPRRNRRLASEFERRAQIYEEAGADAAARYCRACAADYANRARVWR
jgi:hypothetical protein